MPKHHPRYPVIRAGEDSGPPPPDDAQIRALLEETLSEDQLYAVLVLMYVGRGDFTARDLVPAYRTVKAMFPSRELAIAQIAVNNTLAEYLTDALEEIQKRHIDLDSLKFASTAAIS